MPADLRIKGDKPTNLYVMDDALVLLKHVKIRQDEISRIPFDSLMGIVITRQWPWGNVITVVVICGIFLLPTIRLGGPEITLSALAIILLVCGVCMFYFKTTTMEIYTSTGVHALISNSRRKRVRKAIGKMLTAIPAAQARARAAQLRTHRNSSAEPADSQTPTETS